MRLYPVLLCSFLPPAKMDARGDIMEAITVLHERVDHVNMRVNQLVYQMNALLAQCSLLRRRVQQLEGLPENTDDNRSQPAPVDFQALD